MITNRNWAFGVWAALLCAGCPVFAQTLPSAEAVPAQSANSAVAIAPVPVFEQQPGAPANPVVERSAARRATSQPGDGAASLSAAMPDWTRVGGAVVAVVGLVLVFRMGAGKWWGMKLGGGKSQALRVVGRSVMGHKQQLILIQVGRRLVLAADSNGQVSRLAEITDAEEVSRLLGEVPMGQQQSFGQALLDAESVVDLLDTPAEARAPRRQTRPLAADDFSELANLSGRLAEIRRGWTTDAGGQATVEVSA